MSNNGKLKFEQWTGKYRKPVEPRPTMEELLADIPDTGFSYGEESNREAEEVTEDFEDWELIKGRLRL